MTFIEATTEAVLEVTIIEAAPPLCTAAEGGDCRLLFVFSLLVTSKLFVFWSFAEEIFVFCWSDEPKKRKKNWILALHNIYQSQVGCGVSEVQN